MKKITTLRLVSLNKFIILLILAPCLLALSACSISGPNFWNSSANQQNTTPLAGSSQAKKPPVEVSILEAGIDAGQLQVRVLVSPLTPISSRDVAVALYGLEQGQVIREEILSLSQAVGSGYLEADTSVELEFELSAEGISEYQVKIREFNSLSA